MYMKGFIIVYFLLSCFCAEGRTSELCDGNDRSADALVEYAGLNDAAILPAGTATFSGNGNSFSPFFRPTNAGRRVQPSTKSSFRVIKSGKVFDRNNFYTFQTAILQFQSGIRSNSRYIYTICHLLI